MSSAAHTPENPPTSLEAEFDAAFKANSAVLPTIAGLAVGKSVELQIIPQNPEDYEQIDALNGELVSAVSQSLRGGRRNQDNVATNAYTKVQKDGTVISVNYGTWFEGGEFSKPIPVALKVVKHPEREGDTPRISRIQLVRTAPQSRRVVFAGFGEHPPKKSA